MAPGPRTLTKDEFQQLLLSRPAGRGRPSDTYELLHDYSHPERAWVKDEIERWLGR